MKEINLILDNIEYKYSIYRKNNDKKYVVFLLGALQDIDSVDNFSKYFSKTINTIVIEAPGTGHTAPLIGNISVRDQAEMVLKLIRHLDIERAHLVGFSYATTISVELCDLWDGVQSLSIGCGAPGIPKGNRTSTLGFIGAAMGGDKKHFGNFFADLMLSGEPSVPRGRAIHRSIVSGAMKFDDHRIESFVENTVRLLAYKPTNLDSITVPCLILVGEYDPYVTSEITQAFYSKLKNAHYVVIKNADHMIHLQYPEKVKEALITLAKNQIELEEKFGAIE